MKFVDTEQAAKLLDVPLLAIGHLVFDMKLNMVNMFSFDEAEVLSLRENGQQYLNRLRK